MSVTVEQVTTRAALAEFIALPLRLQPRNLAVPLLEASIRSWFTGRSPHPEPIALLLARDSRGTAVGRTTAHTDRRLDARLGERLQLFGATDFRDGEAAAALFDELERRATDEGAAALLGPVSLLPNQAGGVITSGFEERGFVDSAWNDALTPIVYEAEGFERWGEADTWIVEMGRAPATAPETEEWTAAGLRLEHGSKREMKRLIPELLTLLNASFAQLPYYTEISAAEMVAATDGLAFLLDENLLLLARDKASGRAVAFVLVVPDITAFVQRVGGRLTLIRQLQLLATRGDYRRDAILVIQGTDPGRQGQGILSLLSRQLQANLVAGGYGALRSTYVGRDNPASAAQFTRFGGRPLHGYTFYRRPVLPPDARGAAARTNDPEGDHP
ncbi:hypothetical protein B7R21_16050 [Subtercola boreus]|uniref:N-acetyltransferase domain-containing protein n=1 Tax=Subtercola boreus TaxID=120213 RepID=A0A3E0VCQ5_9MICO|nr:hypothetical protein [Subtercola boreus]RFA07676.1 hypothetical protein B7R21_16050 [Subtercola boreus]